MLNNFIQNILDNIRGNGCGEGYFIYSKDICERPIPFSKTIRRNSMKKAVLVNDYASVEALNKLFEEGYEIQSTDEHGVYILTKEDNIKKSINTELSTNITLDTTKAKRAFDLLGETVKQIKGGEHDKKKPHVRIEFDDIRDVPMVWVDGELIGDVDSKLLVSLKIDWNTETATENRKGFDVSYFDMTDGYGKSTGFHEGSLM